MVNIELPLNRVNGRYQLTSVWEDAHYLHLICLEGREEGTRPTSGLLGALLLTEINFYTRKILEVMDKASFEYVLQRTQTMSVE